MADENDAAEKTEEPTPKKLEDARKKGQVPSSRELNHWFIIMGATLFVLMSLPSLAGGLTAVMYRFLEQPHLIPVGGEDAGQQLFAMIGDIGLLMLLPCVLMVAAALAPGLLQTGFLVSVESLKPKLQKISVFAGFKRLFSLRSVVEFVKGLFKLAIVTTIATVLLLPEFDRIELTAGMPMEDLLGLLHRLILRLLVGVLAVMAVIAVADLLYQRFDHVKKLRMSRQEVKEEFKQTEGDPMVKQRLRQIRMERSRRRMMAAVPTADVVVTNPTHFAVALKYDPDTMAAPKCVAKGGDHIALRIREVARENGVALVENPPLARALFASVEIDQEVPTEHYRAVAEVISFVWRLKKR
ncbi:MAG: flagellar biosynthesis protein FlhB [Alphaproteobacteria bacterium]